MELGVALDVGLMNMSLCAYTWPIDDTSELPAMSLMRARERLETGKLERWEVQPIVGSKTATFADRAAGVAEFVRARTSLFEQCAYVVVEHQMQAPMRVIAAALFAAIRMVSPAPLIFQQSSTKLKWNDLHVATDVAVHSGNKAYAVRKKIGIQCACFLLHVDLPKKRPAAVAHCTTAPEIFITEKKRDDLADALLHLLAYDQLQKSKPKKGTKRKNAPGS